MVKFAATMDEMKLVVQLAKRAARLASKYGGEYPQFEALMDIEACHCNGMPLDLTALSLADDANFAHDVFGIRRHIDRKTGELKDCFVPRYSRRD